MSGTQMAQAKEPPQAAHQRQSLLPRACENCRVRKIRCTRSFPCTNCQIAGIACEKARNEVKHRQRINVSERFERQVERLHERLGRIEEMLKSQSVNTPRASYSPANHGISSDPVHSKSRPALFEGDSSFNTQSMQASEVARATAGMSVGGEVSELNESISHLKQLLTSNAHTDPSREWFRFASSPSQPCQNEMDLIPVDFVLEVVRKVKASPPLLFHVAGIRDHFLLELLCRAVYFPIDPVSLGAITTMHGLLYFLLQEYIDLEDPLSKTHDLKSYAALCTKNFCSGIETYEILAEPSFENLLALMLAIVKAHDEASPLLCSTFCSVAARHSQALGYHREATYINLSNTAADDRRHLFWTVYAFDKSISLMLGRASSIQDSEIDAQYFKRSSNPRMKAWDDVAFLSYDIAKLQGQVYELLYSPAAVKLPEMERAQHVEFLAVGMQKWHVELFKLDLSGADHCFLMHLIIDTWNIIYYSTLTSIYWAGSVPGHHAEISSRCYEAARLGLENHLECFAEFLKARPSMITDYANFVLFSSSFTPFIVVFLHAIASNSEADMQLLEKVVESLKHVRGTSHHSEHLYQTCTTFNRIAKRLVESRTKSLPAYPQPDDFSQLFGDFDPGLAFPGPNIPGLVGQNIFGNFSGSDFQSMSSVFGSWGNGVSIDGGVQGGSES